MPLLKSIILTIMLGWSYIALAAPSIDEIEEEVRAFQEFFTQRFPDVKPGDFGNGSMALAQFNHKQKNRSLLTIVPPYAGQMSLALEEWDKRFLNGASMDDCFNGFPAANEFPFFSNGKVHTAISVINDCFIKNNQSEISFDSIKMARLVAKFKQDSNGKEIQVNYSAPEMRELFAKGRQYFWARRGQNNFSCASCHVDNAGNRLRGDVLSAALGHSSAYPVYSSSLATRHSSQKNPWQTLHQRYSACNIQAGAAPQPSQSEDYIALQIYQAILNTGIKLTTPGFRQ